MQQVETVVDYTGLPERTADSLRMYLQGGVIPGSALTAVLHNNLRAILMVDNDLYPELRTVYLWLLNRAPPECWGSPEAVAGWIKARRAAR